MPKFYALDGSTVREAKKVFVNDGGTIREAKKIFALDGSTVRQVFDSFSFAFRGSKSVIKSSDSKVGFNFHFVNGTGVGAAVPWNTPTTQGTWDPQAGDIIILAQVSSRHFSMGVNTPNGYTNLDGHSVWYEGGATYSTSYLANPGSKGEYVATNTHRLTASIAYRKLTGDSFSIDNKDNIYGTTGSLTDLVAATGIQGISAAGGAHGNLCIAQLFRPTTTSYSVAGTQVNPTPTPSDSVLSNQTITAQTDDAVIQFALGVSGSNVSTAQTLTTSTGANTTTVNVNGPTGTGTYGTGGVSGSLITLTDNLAANTATAVDRGQVNFLFSGSIRLTAT
jgi:hypothetical protein